MFDFFDEDFPLTKKQEEEYRKKLEAENSEPQSPAPDEPEPVSEDIALDTIKVEEPDYDDYDDEPDDDYDEPEDGTPAESYAREVEKIMSGSEEAAENDAEEIADEPEQPSEEPESVSAEETPEYAEPAEQPEPEQPEPEQPEPEQPAEEAHDDDDAPVLEKLDESELYGGERPTEPEENDAVEHEMPPTEPAPEVPDISEKMASIDEIEAHLHEELRTLGEKLDTMERAVDGMEDGEISEGFDYEYDERYYAEEETPAYLHPELYGRSDEESASENRAANIEMSSWKEEKKPAKKLMLPQVSKKKSASLPNIGAGTVAAAAAAAVALIALLGSRKKKK